MYKSFYNLSQNPFQLTANLSFFFDSASHKRAKAYLRYGLLQGEGFVVVTGVPGTGKTMLVKNLFQSIQKEEDIVIGLMVTSQVGAEDTLRMLAGIFKIAYEYDDNKAALLSGLEAFFKKSARLGKRVLLVVDEAQNLPKESIEELRMLSNYEWAGKVIFQVFLVGQEELSQVLYASGMEQVKQRIVASYHLKAIEKQEIKEYITFRLEKVGWKNNPQFTDDVFDEIYNFTAGIPRRINTLCDRLLLYGFLEELSVINLDSTQYVIKEIESDYASIEPTTESSNTISNITITANASESERIMALEKKVTELTTVINKERALLRKAILIQLDMDEVYSEQ